MRTYLDNGTITLKFVHLSVTSAFVFLNNGQSFGFTANLSAKVIPGQATSVFSLVLL